MDIGGKEVESPIVAGKEKEAEPNVDIGGKEVEATVAGAYIGAEKDSEPTVVAGGMNVEDIDG
jgi:hypothetical protein